LGSEVGESGDGHIEHNYTSIVILKKRYKRCNKNAEHSLGGLLQRKMGEQRKERRLFTYAGITTT